MGDLKGRMVHQNARIEELYGKEIRKQKTIMEVES